MSTFARYTEAGEITVHETFDDDTTSSGHIGWYDADGGTWEDEVRDMLRAQGFAPVGEWTTDDDGSATITVRR